MSRRIKENDGPVLQGDVIGPNVLGDAARLGLRDIGLPNGVQQGSLPVVNVAHDGHDRRSCDQFFRVLLFFLLRDLGLSFFHNLRIKPVIHGNHHRRFGVNERVHVGHLTHPHQLYQQIRGRRLQQLRESFDGNGLRKYDFLWLPGGRLRLNGLLYGFCLSRSRLERFFGFNDFSRLWDFGLRLGYGFGERWFLFSMRFPSLRSEFFRCGRWLLRFCYRRFGLGRRGFDLGSGLIGLILKRPFERFQLVDDFGGLGFLSPFPPCLGGRLSGWFLDFLLGWIGNGLFFCFCGLR